MSSSTESEVKPVESIGPIAVAVTPVSTDEASPQAGTSNREKIKQRLREKEVRLSIMLSNSRAQSNVEVDDNSIPDLPKKPPIIIQAVGKEDADRREAVRVLSQAALQMQERLRKERHDAAAMRDEIMQLRSSQIEYENEKARLEEENQRLATENQHNKMMLAYIQRNLDEKTMSLDQLENISAGDMEQNLKKQLKEAHREVVWTQKDAMSKTEQIEYFEYQLLAKNQEVDDLKQELSTKLRKIVELEIDLEMHDDRFSTRSRTGSYAHSITTADNFSVRNAVVFEHTPPLHEHREVKNNFRDSFRKILSMGRSRKLGAFPSSRVCLDDPSSNSLMDRLQSDLSNLEGRYKRDKYASRMQIEQLKQENNEYLIKILSLEKSLQNALVAKEPAIAPTNSASQITRETLRKVSSQDDDELEAPPEMTGLQPEMLPNKILFLEETVESLENKNDLQARRIADLSTQIKRLEGNSREKSRNEDQVVEQLRLDNETKELKIAALEQELQELTQVNGRAMKGFHVNAAVGLESKLQENLAEVVRLRNELEMKDRKIETLRAEIIELRLLRMQFEKASQSSELAHSKRLASITEDAGVPQLTNVST